ncbi:hypothetical protein N7478_011770 [Penicillium angulare]|uniref:uncharacterized protein n=1 Tax=Penicillium angulare TaxID=116970 RepID=UPI00253FB815|nr:uncharacterized protein N7478_011770 [Penicillium angulare]KAJ5261175.1 hypothetical protein N7478_011770 [Penicillium angulare]
MAGRETTTRSSKQARIQGNQTRGRKRDLTTAFSAIKERQEDDTTGTQAQNALTNPEVAGSHGRELSTAAQYRAWRKRGSLHNSTCFECGLPDDLEICETCPLACHQSCMLNNSTYANHDGLRRWFCHICVGRGWHLNIPPLTPPHSPIQNPVDNTGPTPSTLPAIQHDPALGGNLTHSQTVNPVSHPVTGLADSGSSQQTKPGASTKKPAARKSKFTTLSNDVDSALRVLYSELETIQLLRQQVSNLQFDNTRLHQDLSICRNEVALARGGIEKSRHLEAEVMRLKATIADQHKETHDTEVLKKENEGLKSEVETIQKQLEDSNKTLAEWKNKLLNLVGD